MVYSNTCIGFVNFHYLHIKCNMSIADEQKYILQMSAIYLYSNVHYRSTPAICVSLLPLVL